MKQININGRHVFTKKVGFLDGPDKEKFCEINEFDREASLKVLLVENYELLCEWKVC